MRLRILSVSILMLAACAPDDGVIGPSASVTPSTVASGGPVAPCVVGEWTTTEVTIQAVTTTGNATITGGKGIRVKIGPNGQTELDFTAMEPVTFAAIADGVNAKGQFSYGGTAAGQVRTTTTTATTGKWEPVGAVDWSKVTISVELLEPLKLRVADKVPLSTYTGDKTGGTVDINPMLGKAEYACGTGTLTLTPVGGMGLSWQFVSALGTPPPATTSPR